jgi:hypothetical protein
MSPDGIIFLICCFSALGVGGVMSILAVYFAFIKGQDTEKNIKLNQQKEIK